LPRLINIPISTLTDVRGIIQPIWLNWFNAVYRLLYRAPTIFTGVAAPTTTPDKIGDLFIDSVLGKVYVATGVSNSTDWKILN